MQPQHPKVVILGAGSLFFGRNAIWQMVHSQHLCGGTLSLVDIDAQRLDKMAKLARMVIDHNQAPLTLEASTDARDVLKDADFVVLSFAVDNPHYRRIDCELSEKYGIRMCSGDTIGPGGILRTMREFPKIIDACNSIRELCPNAWVINYINPAAVHGIGLKRFFPDLKSFALCDAQFKLSSRYALLAGVKDDEKLKLLTTGPNHFTWLMHAEYDGRDLIPDIVAGMRRRVEEDANIQAQGGTTTAKGLYSNGIAVELYDALGLLPTVIGHTKEYVRFYQGLGRAGKDTYPPLKLFEYDERIKWTNAVWARVDEYLDARVPIHEFDTEFGPDPAVDVIETMWGNLGKQFFINTFNNGTVPNMADDAFLEMYCDIDMDGPRPQPIGPMVRGIRAMCEIVLDTHELTAEAVYKKDYNLLRRALLVDPLTNSIGDTDALLRDLVEAESKILPAHWQRAMA